MREQPGISGSIRLEVLMEPIYVCGFFSLYSFTTPGPQNQYTIVESKPKVVFRPKNHPNTYPLTSKPQKYPIWEKYDFFYTERNFDTYVRASVFLPEMLFEIQKGLADGSKAILNSPGQDKGQFRLSSPLERPIWIELPKTTRVQQSKTSIQAPNIRRRFIRHHIQRGVQMPYHRINKGSMQKNDLHYRDRVRRQESEPMVSLSPFLLFSIVFAIFD